MIVIEFSQRTSQGIIDPTGTENRQIFFSYACNGKKLKSCT